MNILKINRLVILFSGLLTIASCKEDLGDKIPSSLDKTVPGVVTNLTVKNLPGKSVLSYTLPTTGDVLYVKGVYTLANGETRIAKSSSYSNQLLLEGFADTLEHEIRVFTVSKSEVDSQPLTVKVKPQEAPIWKVFKSLNIENNYGGYNLSAVNLLQADVSIMVMRKNLLNELEVDNYKSVFTNSSAILSKVRGLDTTKHLYAFYVRDKWGNSTDTLVKEIKPLYEVQLDITKFREYSLPGDASMVTNGNPRPRVAHIWDGRLLYPFVSFTNQGGTGGTEPHMITFDTGVMSKVSRVWIRPFPEGRRTFYLSTMKRFEIYGSAAPSTDGKLDASWHLLGSYELKRPSDLPYGTDDTPEEDRLAKAGFDWEADLNAPKVRYIRIKCLENFAGGTNQSIDELRVYGDPR